jgi:hypothetical protein
MPAIENIWTNMTPTAKRHMRAICGDAVTKSNVIGLRKILNAQARKDAGLSISRVAPAVTAKEVADLVRAMEERQPRVVGELHDSGVKLLRAAAKRYRSRFTEETRAAMESVAYFRLIGFVAHSDLQFVPAYRVFSAAGPAREGYGEGQPRPHFAFYNPSWQSGGNGPEILL